MFASCWQDRQKLVKRRSIMMKYGLRSRSKTTKGHPPPMEKAFGGRHSNHDRDTSSRRQRQQRRIQRPADTAQISFAVLRVRNQTSNTISNEVKVRRSTRLLGKKVMSYDEEARAKGAAKETIKSKAKRGALEAGEPELELELGPEMTAPVARMI
ncbi:hypothetical protein V491_06707 [Pseudogymnoascus sp. VKM F-3775]|nr:hypothetical protein V491_06707 [Pseudogymnoascus sp. VKM F-3775]